MRSLYVEPLADVNTFGNGIYFPIDVLREIKICAFSVHLVDGGNVRVYHRVGGLGSAVGPDWNEIFVGLALPKGYQRHSLPKPALLGKGSHMLLFSNTGGIRYSNVTGDASGLILAQDDCLIVSSGVGVLSTALDQEDTSLDASFSRGRSFIGSIEYDPSAYIAEQHAKRIVAALRRDNDYADIEIVCGSQAFTAHRVILSVASQVFATVLKADMAEKRTGKIFFDDEEPGTISAALQFVYEGTLPNDVGHEVIRFAHKYDIQGLVACASEHIVPKLTVDNVASVMRVLNPLKRQRGEAYVDTEVARVHALVRKVVQDDTAMIDACLDSL